MNTTRERALERLREMVVRTLAERDAAVYLFGSCARGNVRPRSDIDIGILPREELPGSFFVGLAEAIDDSTIPYDVELVDLREVSADFLDEVRRTGVVWRA
jgi:predicted nucleotidyltransferase